MKANLNMKGINRAFNKDLSVVTNKTATFENPPESEEANDAPQANSQPERYKIANFTEELRDRANYEGLDICFVIDATASMGAYIEGAKESLRTIMEDAKESLVELNAEEDSLKFAVVAYRDHPPQDVTWVTNSCDFTNADDAKKFLATISAAGGGDAAEAVIDGLYDALNKVSWREKSEKFLFLVADAPPHGKIFGSCSDGFPKGCPCEYSEMTVLPGMRDKKIDFTILKISNEIEQMIAVYSQYINIDIYQPKIFQEKKTNTAKYCTAVSSEMKTAMNSKVCTSLKNYK